MINMEKNSKYLGELIDNKLVVNRFKNTLIVSPTGSGKTYYMFNDLVPKYNKALYLCDNKYLKASLQVRDEVISNNKKFNEGFNTTVETICYKEFGKNVRFNNDFMKQYDLIICDEIHNLISYQNMKDDADLSHAIKELFGIHEGIKICYFTATPDYLNDLKNVCKDIDRYTKTIDFSKNPYIKRYRNRVSSYFSGIEQIPMIFNNNRENFELYGEKALIYTQKIDSMISLSDTLEKAGYLKPICLWSTSNLEKPMNKEQLRVATHLLEYGELLEPYNVLIINRSMETGVNIIDKKMVYCITNTTNKTERIQARGRLRHDIFLWARRDIKRQQNVIDEAMEINPMYLDRPLTKADKDALCEELNILNCNNKLVKWKGLKPILENKGYIITEGSKRINGKVTKYSLITRA